MKYTDKLDLPIWNEPETDVFDIEQFNKGMQAIDDIVINILEQINNLVIGDTQIDLNGYVKEEVLKQYAKRTELSNFLTQTDLLNYLDKTYLDILATKDELSSYAKTTQLQTTNNNITNLTDRITALENSGGNSSSGTGLTEEQANNIEKIPSIEGTVASNSQAIANKADKNHKHTEYLKKIPDEYVTDTELSSKGYATETFVTSKIAEASLSGGDVDLSGYATKDDIPTKTSELTNDSGFITTIPDIYALKADANKLNCITIDNVSLKEYILTNFTGTKEKTYYLIAKTTCTDLPKASNFFITVETPGAYTYKVTAKELNDSNGIYVCTYRTISSLWTAWEKVALSSDLEGIPGGGGVDTTSFATDLSLTGSKLQLKNNTGALIGNPITLPTSSESSSEWSGKVANFLGDSQTEKNQHKTKIYHDWVKEILGLSKVNNYGISGATIAKKSSNDRIAMCLRYTNMDDNADLICVMGGVNDRWFNCQMGSFGDTNETTFYGAMEILCDGLLTKYPGKTIIFITPTEQNNPNCNSSNKTGYTPTDFANAMKRVCAKYSIPVFDANTCSGIYPLNEANASLYTTDKLHLNDKGNEVLGNKLSKFILNGANVVVINNGDSGEDGGGSTGDTYGNIVISKTTATINEGGTDTFTVKLDKAPTNSQMVNISSNNADVTLSASTLTFNSSNYSTPQTVTINVAEDSDAVNDNCKLTLSSSNVSSKTITITITDNDTSPETPTPPETPGENQFVGKTVRVTKNFASNYAHLVALLNVDEDMRNSSTYTITLSGSNATNMTGAKTAGGTLFIDSSGEVSNGLFDKELSKAAMFTQTVSDGNLTITAEKRTGLVGSGNYVKVPIIVSGTTPYSFQIDEIKVIVNDVERNILKLGSFFTSDKEAITIE